jgi:hypothetical protein
MAWTYEPANLGTSLRDQVRLRIGDTVADDPLLEDEEIDFFLAQREGDVISTCYDCVANLIARYSNNPDFKLGPYTETNSTRISNWKSLLNTFAKQSVKCAAPIALAPETRPIFSYDMMSRDRIEDTPYEH